MIKVREILESEGMKISIRKLCDLLEISRTAFYREPRPRNVYKLDTPLALKVRSFLEKYPTYGVRKLTWIINREGTLIARVNWKSVYRILRRNGWIQHKKAKGYRPRVRGKISRTEKPNERWAIDTTHFSTKKGWCHLTAVIDCCDRSLLGWRASYSGKTKVAVAALEDALVERKPARGLVIRSDNGLVFSSQDFRKTTLKNGLEQEFITPYTPEQNGMIERFFRTLKEECVWLNVFDDLEDAQSKVAGFIDEYNNNRPHWSLGFKTPVEFFNQLAA